MKFTFLLTLIMIHMTAHAQDPFQYLEEVDGTKALEFVNQQNQLSFEILSKRPEYDQVYNKSLEIYNSKDRIEIPTVYAKYIYNFWQDPQHIRGIWRRTSANKYISGKPDWETILDLDEMQKKDSIKWVFKGATGLFPDYNRFMINLSKGGGDAVIIREFDVNTRQFISDGFSLAESKGNVSYIDKDLLIVATDFGNGSMTSSGYPSKIKLWKRGTLLENSPFIFEGDVKDVGVWQGVWRDEQQIIPVIIRRTTFYTGEYHVLQNNKLIKLDLPSDIEISELLNNQLTMTVITDWKVNGTVYKQGSLISMNFSDLLQGKKTIKLMYQPDKFSSITSVNRTKNNLLVNILNNVKNELFVYSYLNNTWSKKRVPAPDFGTISIVSTDETSDAYYFLFTNFLKPSSLYLGNSSENRIKTLRSLPSFFDAEKFKVKQYMSTSADGNLIPYFVVSSKSVKLNGNNPTLLYAYGGFQISSLPAYSAVIGNAWLEKGGVYVLANIRGGGEFGPGWHQAGLKEKRQNVFNDFHSVAEDLIKRKFTSSKHLGIYGGSNGGLLVGVAFTQRPDLYNAVVCAVPLLDMQRYNKLLAGASWMGEYGDPDKTDEWAYIQKYSPYQNLKKGVKYPEVYFTTSTRDDRVHPGHARKMVAKMLDMGYPVYYYENTEGGHAGSSTNEQRAKSAALMYSYLWMKLR